MHVLRKLQANLGLDLGQCRNEDQSEGNMWRNPAQHQKKTSSQPIADKKSGTAMFQGSPNLTGSM